MLTLFGSVAVAVMFLSYALGSRSKWMVLAFAAGSAATAAYSALPGAYPITVTKDCGPWRRCSASGSGTVKRSC